jgi:hypothetical protein
MVKSPISVPKVPKERLTPLSELNVAVPDAVGLVVRLILTLIIALLVAVDDKETALPRFVVSVAVLVAVLDRLRSTCVELNPMVVLPIVASPTIIR